MAIGFTPKHLEHYPVGDLTIPQFLALSVAAAQDLGWDVYYISNSGFKAIAGKGMLSWEGDVTMKISDGIAEIKSESTGSEMADMGKNKKAVLAFIESVEALRSSRSTEELTAAYTELGERVVPDQEDILKLPPPTRSEKINGWVAIFTPRPGYFIAPILIDINIIIFILMAVSGVNILAPDSQSLVKWGANFTPYTLNGQWWRLLTNCFLHIGIMHLLLNMVSLMYVGTLLEPFMGRARFLAAYLLCGIGASVTSLWWHELTVSAGASGAIFGMYGVFLALLTTSMLEKKARMAMLKSLGILVGINLLYGLKAGIDNAAHIGGLICGVIIGYSFWPGLRNTDQPNERHLSIPVITVVVLAITYFVYTNIPNDIATYDTGMNELTEWESKALLAYDLDDSTSKNEVMHEIKDSGLFYWRKCVALVDSFDRLRLPDQYRERNGLLRHYFELRIQRFELWHRSLNDGTAKYNDHLAALDKEIEQILAKLNAKQ